MKANEESNAGQHHGRASEPGYGISLATATEARSRNLREAVAVLTDSLRAQDLNTPFGLLFGPRWSGSVSLATGSANLATRTAWNLVSVWLLARASGQGMRRCSLAEAEEWFLGAIHSQIQLISALVDESALRLVQGLLVRTLLDKDFWDLLPYVLEEYGAGSRASVMRDPATALARARKRKEGVFYTPSDVADYMVRHTLENFSGSPADAKCLDPACGTGVFLLALLRFAEQYHLIRQDSKFDRLGYITSFLHGCDISAHALDACAFLLLRECLSEVQSSRMSPWAAWHLIRMNLVEVDAITLEPPATHYTAETASDVRRLAALRWELSQLPSRYVAPEREESNRNEEAAAGRSRLFGSGDTRIEKLFPGSPKGFDIIVGNPPFATLGDRGDYASLSASYHSLTDGKVGARENIYPLFVEMMWRLTIPGGSASALVTPLSIAFHRGAQFEGCRYAMMSNGGRWQFAFFDRQPHALFGEEVKTRNAILFRFENAYTFRRQEQAEVDTGPLRKWTSRTRRQLFQGIDFTPLGQMNIRSGIPKLRGRAQAGAYIALRNRLERFPSFCARVTTCEPEEAFHSSPVPRVFVGGTAYNFLNVYRTASLHDSERAIPLSQSSIHSLEFLSEEDARAGFAILSSRVVFWLWHVLGDGFHVGSWLFNEIPFARFGAEDLGVLAALGHRLWERLQTHRFVSLNGGKQTIGFRPLGCNEERDAVDIVLVRAAGLALSFTDELRRFVQDNAVVDSRDQRRSHLTKYFTEHPNT